MNGTRKSRPPAAVVLATTSRVSGIAVTSRFRACEVRDIPARLTEALTVSIREGGGTPSSVIFTGFLSAAAVARDGGPGVAVATVGEPGRVIGVGGCGVSVEVVEVAHQRTGVASIPTG
jgi:hypothetical protein